MEKERTIIKGFYNRGEEETEPKQPMEPEQYEDYPEEINVTWLIYGIAGTSVAALILSIIALVMAC